MSVKRRVGGSIRKKVMGVAAATTATFGSLILVATLPASAATPACSSNCISVFSRELGTSAQPNFVEAILGGEAQAGQPVGLKQASGSDPSEDIIPQGGSVSAFYAAGMVSAEVNHYYAGLLAVQQEYAPLGTPSGLCVGLASVAYQDEGLTLQPCGVSATTVWIIDPAIAPTTRRGYFPIINGSTTDFSRPFAMDLPRDELVSAAQTLQMQTRHLQFLGSDRTLPDRQLWGVHRGPLN
jgi:hypothetical protein